MSDVLDTTTSAIELNIHDICPSHICIVCECLEYSSAEIVTNEPWLCDKCKMALRRVVERETYSCTGDKE